jgi:YHS domain-containing protein
MAARARRGGRQVILAGGGAIMASLEEMDRRIKDKLALSEERRHSQHDHVRQRMSELEDRLARYTNIADRLMGAIIRPRMEKLASHFENARSPQERNSRHGCAYRFEHTPRFPATVTFEVGVTRDGEARTVEVQSTLIIVPSYFAHDGCDRLVLPLNEVDDEKVADWVEEKIIAFADTYLRLETADSYQATNVAIDPVCGMAVNKAHAPATLEHGGVVYFFCLEACRDKFAADPGRYLPGYPQQQAGV